MLIGLIVVVISVNISKHHIVLNIICQLCTSIKLVKNDKLKLISLTVLSLPINFYFQCYGKKEQITATLGINLFLSLVNFV